MKMKKKLALVLAVIMMLSLLTACGGKGTSLKDIQKAGKLVIATSPDFPPFESLGADGSVEGIEIDLLNIICDKLGVELAIEQMDFDSVLPGVQAGKFDVGVSGITVTEQRQKNVLFIVTLASQNIAKGIAYVFSGGKPIRCMTDAWKFLGAGYVLGIPTPVWTMFIVFFLCVLFLNRTRTTASATTSARSSCRSGSRSTRAAGWTSNSAPATPSPRRRSSGTTRSSSSAAAACSRAARCRPASRAAGRRACRSRTTASRSRPATASTPNRAPAWCGDSIRLW